MSGFVWGTLVAFALWPALRRWIWAERIIWRHRHPRRPEPVKRRIEPRL